MTPFQIFLVVGGVAVGLPILAYLVMKFGTTGYLRAKKRGEETNQPKEYDEK